MNAGEIAGLILNIEERAVSEVDKALRAGADPVELLQDGVIRGLEMIGEKFEAKEYFLGELMMGGKIAEDCIARIDPCLPDQKDPPRGIVVIGAVQGDLHDIGYSLVAKQLELAGFEVHQMGVNVPTMSFIEKAQEVDADIIGLSAFLVTTIPNCEDVINYLRDMGLRDRFRVIIGGAETTQETADTLGADGWAPNAVEAVTLCKDLVKQSN